MSGKRDSNPRPPPWGGVVFFSQPRRSLLELKPLIFPMENLNHIHLLSVNKKSHSKHHVIAINSCLMLGKYKSTLDAIHEYFTSDEFTKLQPSSKNRGISEVFKSLKIACGKRYNQDEFLQLKLKKFFNSYKYKVPKAFRPGRIRSRQQLGELLTWSGPKTSLWMLFLYKSGCRVSEACNIKLSDISDFDDNDIEIKIHGKGHKKRYILVSKKLFFSVRETFGGKAYLFETSNGRKYPRNSVAALIYEASLRILGYKVGPHDFRKACSTFASRETRVRGGDIKSVMGHTGHSDANIFINHYVNFDQLKPSAIPEPDWSGERLGYRKYKKERKEVNLTLQPQSSIVRDNRRKKRQKRNLIVV